MISFSFSIEQLRSAPAEVRRWIESEVGAALAALDRPEHGHAQPHGPELAACTPEEAAQVFALIKDNFPLSQVFFELARELPQAVGSSPLYALGVAELLRHSRIADADRLANCLAAINSAFQGVRGDGEAALFGFDQFGRVYIHHDSIRLVWQQLLATHAPEPSEPPAAGGPSPFGFTPPRLGPSENVAQHRPDFDLGRR